LIHFCTIIFYSIPSLVDDLYLLEVIKYFELFESEVFICWTRLSREHSRAGLSGIMDLNETKANKCIRVLATKIFRVVLSQL